MSVPLPYTIAPEELIRSLNSNPIIRRSRAAQNQMFAHLRHFWTAISTGWVSGVERGPLLVIDDPYVSPDIIHRSSVKW